MVLGGVIFDLNGTILDDEDLYGEAFNSVLKSLGVDTSKPIPHERGIGVKENWLQLIKTLHITTDKTPEVLTIETQKEYLKKITGSLVRPGFDDFVDHLKESGIKIGLATSNTWEVATEVLEKTDLVDVFDSITTEEEVQFNKPDPSIFIVEADKLGLERHECLVIEDAESGVTAARRAGMKVIAVSSDGETYDKLSKADLVVEGFSEITPKIIEEM